MLFDRPVICLDVETTGASPLTDRITEIGIVEIGIDGVVSEWSTLVNPQAPIPEFIEKLTGISNAMVEDAPTFGQIADELMQKIEGKVFVAHNARFDYAFVKNEFNRLDTSFRADTLCTVRLSRRLYPQYYKHNLDSLIQRMGIITKDRHRALADARVLMHFLQRLPQEHDAETIQHAIRHVMAKPALPPAIPESTAEDLPESPGVYLFHGENDIPLYIGKGSNIRSKVLSHFAGEKPSARSLRLAQQITRIDWRETAGELGALLLEAQLIKRMQPIHHQRHHENDLCTWQLIDAPQGGKTVVLRSVDDLNMGREPDLYGLFTSQRKAIETLRSLAEAHRLSPIQLGLEKTARKKTKPDLDLMRHDLRLMQAIARLKVQPWPYPGPIGIKEAYNLREDLHVVDCWRYLGTAKDENEIVQLLQDMPRATFDLDTYKILVKRLGTVKDVVILGSG